MPERPEAAPLFGRRIGGRRQGRQTAVPPAAWAERAFRDPGRQEAAAPVGRGPGGRWRAPKTLVQPALEHEHAFRDLDCALDILLDLGEEVAQGAVEARHAAATGAPPPRRRGEADGGNGEAKLRLQLARQLAEAVLDGLLGERVELGAGAAEVIGGGEEDELRLFLASLQLDLGHLREKAALRP